MHAAADPAALALDATILADCGADCPDGNDFLLDYARHLTQTYPNRAFGLIESTDDATIEGFFGFGADNCTSYNQVSGQDFGHGLTDIRLQLALDANFGSFCFTGEDHTSLESGLDLRSAEGVALTTWIASLVDAGTGNIGP